MAYIPPHKRHSKDSDAPLPTPSLFLPQYHKNHNHSFKNSTRTAKFLNSRNYINEWFLLLSNDPQNNNHQNPKFLPGSIRLFEVPHELLERRDGSKPFILLCDGVNKDGGSSLKNPWVSIVERVKHDLVSSFRNARTEMCKEGSELIMPRFVIRLGKVLFHSGPSISFDNVHEISAVESLLSQMKRRYYTNVPESFVQDVLNELVHKSGLGFFGEKEYYHVKVSDKLHPASTISCKCSLNELSGELDLYKITLNEVRQMVVDISCLDKNLDLRLLSSSKRSLNSPTDEERQSLNSLVKLAVKDSEVKGGLRWPLGKESFGDRYTVVGIWHTKAKTFKNANVRLKVKDADRFDFNNSIGEFSREVNLRIPELNKQLRDETLELNPLIDMVSDALKFVWDNFLCWEGSFV